MFVYLRRCPLLIIGEAGSRFQLLVGIRLDERSLREITTVHAPIVLVGAQSDKYDLFCGDDVAGSRLAVSHLIEQGHERIGLITSSTKSDIQARRMQGYREALDSHALAFDAALIAGGPVSRSDQRRPASAGSGPPSDLGITRAH